MDELTIADLEGRRTWERFGRILARSKNRPFKTSRLALSTALCVARRSAVLALLEALRGALPDPPVLVLLLLLLLLLLRFMLFSEDGVLGGLLSEELGDCMSLGLA